MPFALGRGARLRVGADVEADDRRLRGGGEAHVGFGDAADAGMHDLRRHLVGAELVERLHDRLDRALHVALDDDREELLALHLQAVHHLLERAARAGGARRRLLALQAAGGIR